MISALLLAVLLHETTALQVMSSDVLLKVSMKSLNSQNMQDWLMKRPFAAVLPMQPMLVQPLAPQPPAGIQLSFRRKPTSEKGGIDGGIRCTLSPVDEDEAGGDGSTGVLLVTRVSEGQSISKLFSERALIKRLIADLQTLPEECGSVRHALVATCTFTSRRSLISFPTECNSFDQVNAVINLSLS